MSDIDNILKQPLPVYSSEAQQAYYTKIYSAQNNLIHNWCSTLRLIPITFTRDALEQSITHVYLVDDDGTKTDIITEIDSNDLIYYSTSLNIDYILYFGNIDLNSSINEGRYHLEITDGTNTWYTEKFCVKDEIEYIEFEYYNSFDKHGFLYNGNQGIGFKNRLRLRTRLVDSREYEIYEEVAEDQNLDKIMHYRKLYKIYNCSALIWDYTNDAIELMRVHDNITFKTFDGNESEIIDIINVIPEKIDHTDYANVNIKFKLRNFIYEPADNLEITSVAGNTFRWLWNDESNIIWNDGKFLTTN